MNYIGRLDVDSNLAFSSSRINYLFGSAVNGFCWFESSKTLIALTTNKAFWEVGNADVVRVDDVEFAKRIGGRGLNHLLLSREKSVSTFCPSIVSYSILSLVLSISNSGGSSSESASDTDSSS
ncbi:hypothetical protein L1987_14945 [Smallanthus sonchifolius]|uniref:Uncharacterized protein n=1 Tax=Smallanthus sonchifolius TaxID=185202 RepID=A0ACB9J6H4_9ASTR|nr:hypothetical protein L1987_14945 [Smallanthus sonchifolius]